MIEETLWHPVALSESVADAPVAVRLLGHNVVLWRTSGPTHQIHAWADRCPHRGAKLSLGRVVDEQLECPYHGWCFDASGHCVKVPALPAFIPPAAHCVNAYGVQEAHGLVWVCMKAAPGSTPGCASALPRFEAEADSQLRLVNCGPFDVATSAPRIIENFLDMAHFGFVHEGSLGERTTTAIDSYAVQRTPTGLLATGCKAWQPQSNVHSTAPAQVEYTYEVTAPYAAVLTKIPDAKAVALLDYREAIALFICPIDPTFSRVWFRMAVADFESPDAKLQDFQRMIFLQDQPILESQSPSCLPLDLRAELHTTADKASSTYRRCLQEWGITFGVC
jgi:phenylpropionate dioxygenase-like ring-hydroxylating dioxygenase large terminal subunit